MATHSSILAWGILWTEEPGRLQQSKGSQSWAQLSTHMPVTSLPEPWGKSGVIQQWRPERSSAPASWRWGLTVHF